VVQKPADATPEARSGIQVIERMMKLLDVLSYHPDPVSLKQLALETGLHPSTAHRILAAMAASGVVERAEAGSYRLGIRLLELGNVVKSRISIRAAAMPLMQRLHQQIGESVNLGVRQGDEIVYVERTSSGRSSIRVVHLVGARAPLHVTAVGKLYLADDSPQQLRDYARRTGLPGFTPTSLTSVSALEREVDRARRHGIAFDNEEIEPGLRCIAAGVREFPIMYAVIKTGGKQYRVAAGEKLKIEQIPADVGAEITLDQVLMVGEGESVKIGSPLVPALLSQAKVVAQGRHDKVKIFKMRRRKHYQKHQGHRQNFTEIQIRHRRKQGGAHMAHKKAGGSSRNGRDSQSKRLGVKRYGGS
jgi:ribosomal protein L21